MKRVLILCAAVILSSAANAQMPTSPNSPEQQIRILQRAMDAAANAHDTDRFMAPFLRSDALVFVINGRVIHGWDALRDQQQNGG